MGIEARLRSSFYLPWASWEEETEAGCAHFLVEVLFFTAKRFVTVRVSF